MPRPKRQLLATAEETLSPPDLLGKGRVIARILRAEGKNLYSAANTSGETLLVELPAKFRSTIWIKKGSFVVINLNAFEERDNKICGEIENVVGDEKAWKKMPYW
jgi:probable RNA-binding protein EIF1AD